MKKAKEQFERRQLDRRIQTIRIGSSFTGEVRAVVWRPWIIVRAGDEKKEETFLVEAATGSVSGEGNFVEEEALKPLPRPTADSSLRFQAMECPTCGWEFRYEIDAVIHFCRNCHRVFAARPEGKQEIEYDHVLPREGEDLVPFWRFPFRLRTAEGKLLTGLAHFKDGIDGTFDQIGDSKPQAEDEIFVPAIRCINPKLMTLALGTLLHYSLDNPQEIQKGRFPLDVKPQPWPVILEQEQARRLAPLLLAEIFSQRDIARVKVQQVQAWIFNSRLEKRGRLCFLPVPRDLSRRYRAYIGRYRVLSLPGGT